MMSQSGRFLTDTIIPFSVETLTGDTGGPISPDPSNNINLFGAHGINTAGNPLTFTITFAINNAITLGDLAILGPGVAALTAQTGDIHIIAGNLTLPETDVSGNAGVIIVDGDRFIHSFGDHNTFVGDNSGNFTLTPGGALENTGVGAFTFASITVGAGNVAVGANAMGLATDASECVALGSGSLQLLTTGDFNTAGGYFSGQALTSGAANTCFGWSALGNSQTSTNNVAIGNQSLLNIGSGSFNTCIGSQSGNNYTTTETNNIVIGFNSGVTGESNTIRLGISGSHTACFVGGIASVNVGSVATVVSIDTGDSQLGTTTITAGTGISVTPGASTITIAATGAGAFSWSVITADQTAAVNHGYICNKGSTLALALPTTSAVGDIIEVTGINNATGWQITQAANQQIFFGTSSTTLGATGTLTSSAIRDSIRIVCVVANLTWNVLSVIGNVTVV
jgi:hypothetical protein